MRVLKKKKKTDKSLIAKNTWNYEAGYSEHSRTSLRVCMNKDTLSHCKRDKINFSGKTWKLGNFL